MTNHPDHGNSGDELDEIVLKPAQWQYDDYLKAKAKLQRIISQEAVRLAAAALPEKKHTGIEIPDTLHRNIGFNQAIEETRQRLAALMKGGV